MPSKQKGLTPSWLKSRERLRARMLEPKTSFHWDYRMNYRTV
ncbi:hypothetical protein CIB84_003037 [Bambusicola thoracicus]|uniref:Uncharacterized protein n=1 Tax=Bambusicola thoracicus TaxID=9083 RepID=A0A2P4TA23_BAMTH|nr:hypothetical protein CIB84_003037 [Bambusicola thoracicus]